MENKDVRILVVDDEPSMADSLKTESIEEGYSVDTAATGAEAIELFDQGGHHLAICDLQLPDMDGLEVMRHMKDARPTTEVIVVTGYGSVARAVEATKAGAFYFVEKPFDFEELQPLVDKALEHRELVAETANMRRQLSTRSEYFNIIGSCKADADDLRNDRVGREVRCERSDRRRVGNRQGIDRQRNSLQVAALEEAVYQS